MGVRPCGRAVPSVLVSDRGARAGTRRPAYLLVQHMSAVEIVTWAALAAGACASIAALWGYYGELPGWLTGPEICRMEGGGCAILFRTPRAALLGIPNASLGIVLYIALAIGLIVHWPFWLLAMMIPAAAMSVFLGWSLISRGLQCRICWTGHVANFTLLIVLWMRALGPDYR